MPLIPENIREAISCFATYFSIEICEEIYGRILKNYKLLFVFYLHDRNNLKN